MTITFSTEIGDTLEQINDKLENINIGRRSQSTITTEAHGTVQYVSLIVALLGILFTFTISLIFRKLYLNIKRRMSNVEMSYHEVFKRKDLSGIPLVVTHHTEYNKGREEMYYDTDDSIGILDANIPKDVELSDTRKDIPYIPSNDIVTILEE